MASVRPSPPSVLLHSESCDEFKAIVGLLSNVNETAKRNVREYQSERTSWCANTNAKRNSSLGLAMVTL